MKISNLHTGVRVLARFGIVLAVMAGMTLVSLWCQQAAQDSLIDLVENKLSKHQLLSEQRGRHPDGGGVQGLHGGAGRGAGVPDGAGARHVVVGEGGNVVADVIRTMAQINDFGKKIEEIVSIIDGIAFQTKSWP